MFKTLMRNRFNNHYLRITTITIWYLDLFKMERKVNNGNDRNIKKINKYLLLTFVK